MSPTAIRTLRAHLSRVMVDSTTPAETGYTLVPCSYRARGPPWQSPGGAMWTAPYDFRQKTLRSVQTPEGPSDCGGASPVSGGSWSEQLCLCSGHGQWYPCLWGNFITCQGLLGATHNSFLLSQTSADMEQIFLCRLCNQEGALLRGKGLPSLPNSGSSRCATGENTWDVPKVIWVLTAVPNAEPGDVKPAKADCIVLPLGGRAAGGVGPTACARAASFPSREESSGCCPSQASNVG